MENRLKMILAIVNNKGGVGKTTTVQNLAAGMLRKDKNLRILEIDLDPQCHLYNSTYSSISRFLYKKDEKLIL